MADTSSPQKRWEKQWRTQIATATGSMVSHFVTYPLENLKTKQQVEYRVGSTSVGDCFRETYNKEGKMGFMRGFNSPLFSYTIVRIVSFSVYQKAKYGFSSGIGQFTGEPSPLAIINKAGSMPTMGTIACFTLSGAAAGAVSAVASTPFELIKNAQVLASRMARGQVKSFDKEVARTYEVKPGMIGTARTILRNLGPKVGLFSGLQLQFIRDTIGTAIFFGSYETVKQAMVALSGSSSPTSTLAVITAGASCGLISLTSTYPIESTKTEYQLYRLAHVRTRHIPVPPVNYFHRPAWKGYPVAAIRSTVSSVVFFSIFERIKVYINEMDDVSNDGDSIV